MKVFKVIPLIIWIFLGVLISISAKSYKLGSFSNPGPGMYPFLIGCFIVFLSSLGMIKDFLSRLEDHSEKLKSFFTSEGLKRISSVIALLIFYMEALEHIGFLICTFILVGGLLKIVERKAWAYTFLASLAVSFLSYVLFQIILKINLPKGFLSV